MEISAIGLAVTVAAAGGGGSFEISTAGIAIGAVLTVGAAVLHFVKGTAWGPTEDITQNVLEHRAKSVPETDFPEPMNRAIGGGGGAVAVGGGDAGGELEEGGDEAGGGSSSPADIPEDEIEHYEIEFVKEGETIEVANNEPLLDAGEDEGWDLPYACRQGQCVSCGGKISGDANELIEHDDQQMLDENEMGDGYVLTCVAYPRGEFSIETSETP
ncbi:2Fe-2S iron-sulfur cluster-binding protein [Halobacteria archaeon AArc-m2/3/4]|uniref:2Fe-2S iron-sulfur cluster-binding protein n=1 Tax=Natronoglomus mannanivorans TaxID=2979990 RepID=A0AAP2Z2N0_9EURY|nr:2Fe-2S iron-sulfur cluster-binding protein [Halobacteria archaeon AArc-xg1-1]MCU4974263.1 2Fe-2S iron-sulfur cluster-binding protein [Halobacteria archaeon AArc-m2/3/4]